LRCSGVICSLQSMPKGIRREQRNENAEKTGYVAYYRVSTDKRGESGLGLEAQREAVRRVAQTAPVLAEFTEVETAKKSSASNRPQLLAAIEEAKKRTATLLIAKLDRLARNVYFISGLMESGVDFIAADMPQANRLTVHIMAAFAEHEARAISDRTTAALGALRARGVKLGNPRWAESMGRHPSAHSQDRQGTSPGDRDDSATPARRRNTESDCRGAECTRTTDPKGRPVACDRGENSP
jgi:DNA invertase Pin-like site-specific DNA recombinase